MERFEITVIGAGVVGLAVAAHLSSRCSSVLVVEKNTAFGMETSSRNSEVIHAGIYYPPDSLKARLCVEGNRLLYELCAAYGIPHKRVGKLIVALDKSEEASLEALCANGRSNGVLELEIIGRERIREMEPHIKAHAAIHSPATGIIDSHSLMKFFLEQAEAYGSIVSFKSEVKEIRREGAGQGYRIGVIDAAGDRFDFVTRCVVNCAGLNCDEVASMAGFDVERKKYRLNYWKGRYFRVIDRKSAYVNRLVYPLPHSALLGLGIHATLNLAGALRLGPDHIPIERDAVDYSVDSAAAQGFLNSAVTYLPFLEAGDLVPDTAGIRPKLQTENDAFRDFIIQEESAEGFPGFVNLIGIESPGLTACPAIARYVGGLLKL